MAFVKNCYVALSKNKKFFVFTKKKEMKTFRKRDNSREAQMFVRCDLYLKCTQGYLPDDRKIKLLQPNNFILGCMSK